MRLNPPQQQYTKTLLRIGDFYVPRLSEPDTSVETCLSKAKYQPIPEPEMLQQFKAAWRWDLMAGSVISWSDIEDYKEQH